MLYCEKCEILGEKKSGESFEQLLKILRRNPEIKEIDFVEDGKLSANVRSFTNPSLYHKVKFPYIRKNESPDKILEKGYDCSCKEGINSSPKINLNVCRHMAYAMTFVAQDIGAHGFGIFNRESELTPLFGYMITEMLENYKDNMRITNYQIYKDFEREFRRTKRIFRDNFLKKEISFG